MSDGYISSLHIQKLGHSLEEIRIRALNHILSKLDQGIIQKNEFSRYLDLLKKLFDWFNFETYSEETKVLKLILRILNSEIGVSIVKHSGTTPLTSDLKDIRSKIHFKYHPLIDQSINTIESIYEHPTPVPPLITDLPLSYRSNQSHDNQNVYLTSSRFGTASCISGVERKSTTVSGVHMGNPQDSTSSCVSPIRVMIYNSVPFVTLNWQTLVKSDCSVLKSVESALQNPPQPTILLDSCEFFCNVMLQDFPAEVFLQRPNILMLFYEMVSSCPSTRITNAALISLNKLTENLIIRTRFYSDPCTYNLKQGTSLLFEPESSVKSNIGFRYNIDLKTDPCYDSETDDYNEIKCNQLNLPHFCVQTFISVLNYIAEKPQSFQNGLSRKKTQSGINTCLTIIDNLVLLLTICVKPQIWDNLSDTTINEIGNQIITVFEKLGDVLEQYRLMVVATNMETFERMAQLHLLHSTSNLLTELLPISKCDSVMPRCLKSALSSSLLDPSFGRLFPDVHETLVQYINVFSGHYEAESLTKYKDVQIVCFAMTKAIKILKHNWNFPVNETLKFIYESLPAIEFHKNLSIINTFLKICVKNNYILSTDPPILKLTGDVLLGFLSHTDEQVQIEVYSLVQKLIVNILGLNHTKHISEKDPGSQIIFMLQTDVFIELSAHGLSSASMQIQTYAEDILIHLLKCKFVVSESIWRRFIRAVMPAMSILQSYMDSVTPLGKAIVKILDPDVSPSLLISQIDVIKGNLRMLFSKDIKLRNEAVSRLCWLLTIEQDANAKIPKIKSLCDCGLSNVFQIEYPIDLNRVRSPRQFYQASSLQQVLELLSSKSIEPSIRRSALTQISVMLEDQFLHSSFLELNGLNVILNIFNLSLNEHQFHNYPDSVIPVMAILKHISLYNSVIRQELAGNVELIYNILRALFLYCTDKRIQQDGALLCCLLLYSEFAIYNHAVKDIGLSLPNIITQKLYIPLKCKTHWTQSRHSKPSYLGNAYSKMATHIYSFYIISLGLLMSDNWSQSTLRMHWNIEWFGGISELVNWQQCPLVLTQVQLAEFSPELRLTKQDLAALKASSVVHCCQSYLFDIDNATTHQAVLEAVRGVAGYISLWLQSTTDKPLLNLKWDHYFSKFLKAPPGNTEDQSLLVEILRMFSIMLKLYKNAGQSCWITQFIQDSSNYLPKYLQIDLQSNFQPISIELLALISNCCSLDQHLLDIGNYDENNKKPRHLNWLHVVQNITDNLKFSDTEQFYNLAYLDKLLLCLVQITSNLGWSDTLSHTTDFHKLFTEMIEALFELLTAFHYGKGAEAASSFMGLNITRNALLTVNHILCEMQHTFKKNWEEYWLSDTVCNSTLFSLFSLWSCRDVVVRAAILQLLAGLASCPRGATVIVENVRQKHGGVWESAMMILIDHTEASIVREQAAVLLTNLCSHVNISANQVALPLCHAPLSTNKDISPMDIVLILLNEYNFYQELISILSCLHLESSFEPTPKNKSNQFGDSVRSYVLTSSGASSTNTEGGVNVYVTPSLVKALANFVSNLLYLAPEKVTESLAEYDLVRGFFRCLTTPSLNLSDSRQFLLYSDTLEMCASVCSMLTRTILVNFNCRTIIIHTRDCLNVLISLLNPDIYYINLPQFLYLRNQLWCEIFRLLTALLELNQHEKHLDIFKECYNVVSNVLAEVGYESFIKSLCDAIESHSLGLQKSALQSLTSLLTIEAICKNANTTSLLQTVFDQTQSPRESSCNTENQENLDPISKRSSSLDKSNRVLLESYRKPQLKAFTRNTDKYSLMVGGELCAILLRLYEVYNLEKSKDKKKFIVIGALASLLNASEEAKKFAVEEGLLEIVVDQLKHLHVELSLHSAESLRKISQKKKVCPILKEVDALFCLLTNFILNNDCAKITVSNLGLADLAHKFWLWFSFERQMLINCLKMLCTFTTNCEIASQSLTLTNPAPGSGPRKIATSISLLIVIINLTIKEMELITRSHEIIVLELNLNLLQNVCPVVECRTIIAKSNILQSLNRLHPAITKRQRPWEAVEILWLDFLQTFTFYPEGQLQITKTSDVLELLTSLTSSAKTGNKIGALSVLRNVAFHHSNRIKLLASVDFLQVLHNKLVNGTMDERNIVISMIWALVANSQRSKIVIKCAGLDNRIQDIIKQYELKGIDDKSYQIMSYVLAVLKEGER